MDEATRTELMATMEQESEKLYRLVENLLALARMELGREIPTEPILVDVLTQKVVNSFSKTRPGRPVEILRRAEGLVAQGELTYLEQVLGNLLSNADKYSPAGAPITVTISSSQDGNEVLVRVQDRGPGVAPEETALIFESFYRSTSTAGKAPGKGLGLTVCKRLIEAQRGRIWARRRQGGGLEVGFSLPVAAANDAEQEDPGIATNGATASVTRPDAARL